MAAPLPATSSLPTVLHPSPQPPPLLSHLRLSPMAPIANPPLSPTPPPDLLSPHMPPPLSLTAGSGSKIKDEKKMLQISFLLPIPLLPALPNLDPRPAFIPSSLVLSIPTPTFAIVPAFSEQSTTAVPCPLDLPLRSISAACSPRSNEVVESKYSYTAQPLFTVVNVRQHSNHCPLPLIYFFLFFVSLVIIVKGVTIHKE